ncbi:hypothetical protein AVEN_33913-1 [Araneus ventricosus]|uniref:Uncharacterized protein n=1 Tax=Araneus ventricosus TaxID=182803 RepID=A0A4Y1ZMI1_ARAVE|nr:hypothetical protein AVEN_33913-1 [Araneus ventricosus]
MDSLFLLQNRRPCSSRHLLTVKPSSMLLLEEVAPCGVGYSRQQYYRPNFSVCHDLCFAQVDLSTPRVLHPTINICTHHGNVLTARDPIL